ncbi:Rne/Rng family ribonuclease [Pseudanabaena sp. UWO311]|uniref:Rne/Rng family ribonuclease n=1 Tax=Pseudanabaena sp. UWO311 TaxID=2487337 RepID=UPI00115A9A1E|nr:Rne/Rng family ribonuclease [Pseudanabaena sp. UWO311]TYQ24592.1 Rne/Rng family ribonuclease [Pseudanabaena sp. UWO311]
MPKQIIIAEQYRIAAVFSEDQIEEIVVAAGTHQVGDVYLGVVENVLTSIDAAFVNIGDGDRNGFIHITDLGPLKMRRSSGSISDLVVPQQRVLVQVMKEPTGNKGPRLTGNISLPGRYVVLLPFGRGVNLSRRIRSEAERNRLRALAILVKPAGMGVLVRTEADGMPEEQIIEDLDNLQRQWEGIQQDVATTRQPTLLDRERDFVQRVLRDLYSTEVNRIVTDTSDGLRRIKQHLLGWGDGKIPSGLMLDHHRERTPILEYFRVNAGIREALKPRVDLPSGGYIIIEPTEALTVIDVNSGSFTKSQTSRETVLWTNCEAAVEIARQVRLRNIAGVIVVDFIDMDTRRDQLQLLEHFNKSLKSDKSRPQIAQLTELGLVELTRKRQGQSIYELFGRPCSTCGGLGHLMHLPGEAAGQPVDATSRTWESKQSNQLDFTSEYEDGDSDLGGGLEPNLVNHPSYQERGNLRRRGKRAMLNKDSRESREPEKVAPVVDVRSRFEPRIEPLIEPRFEPRVEREIVVDRSVPAKLSLPNIASNIPATKAIAEPSEELVEVTDATPVVIAENLPERPNKREIRTKVIEPPELIVVEMTEEEQDVYSLIGVSPLVLLDREVKDPRNVIVTVALPGQAPKIANNMGNLRSSAESNNESSSESRFDSTAETNNSADREDDFEERFAESEITELPSEVLNSSPVSVPVKTNGTSNGVILRVNRAQSVDSADTDENSDLRGEPSEASKEFVPIQSPEASRRKRSSASQI